MGAVTAIKTYSLLHSREKINDINIMGLVLDSPFISLRRMVIEVGRARVNIPEILIKALFVMVGSSI
jgi:hypothetical protein